MRLALSTRLAQHAAAISAALLLAAGPATPTQAKEAPDDELIVQLRPVWQDGRDSADITALLVKHRLSLVARFGERAIYRLKVVGRVALKDKIDALRREPQVQSVEPNVAQQVVEPTKNVPWTINDGGIGPQAGNAWAARAIHLAEAHQLSTGRGVRVAVLDTGIDRSHPAFAGRLLPGFDFVDFDTDPSEQGGPRNPSFGHGTHVAGVIAMVAPGARILPLRIVDEGGYSNAWVLAEAMLHAVDPDGNPATDDGAHVINLSLSSMTRTQLFKTVAKLVACRKAKPVAKGSVVEEDDDSGDDLPFSLSDQVRCSGFGGAVVIAASGNHGSDKLHEYPAAEPSPALASVAATTQTGRLAGFSNFGWVKLAAPGLDIESAVPGGAYAVWSGTSMAAPFVAGTAALLRAHERQLGSDQVVKRLRDTGSALCGTKIKQLDALAALRNEKGKAAPKPDKEACHER